MSDKLFLVCRSLPSWALSANCDKLKVCRTFSGASADSEFVKQTLAVAPSRFDFHE